MEDKSLKKPRTTWYICPIFTSSQLATTQQTGTPDSAGRRHKDRADQDTGSTWVQSWGERSYQGTEGGRRQTGGVPMVGSGKQVLRKPGFLSFPHRTTFLQAPFPMETKFI